MSDILAWAALLVALVALVLAYLAYCGTSHRAELKPAFDKSSSTSGAKAVMNAPAAARQPAAVTAAARSELAVSAPMAVSTPTAPATQDRDETCSDAQLPADDSRMGCDGSNQCTCSGCMNQAYFNHG